MCIRDRVYSDSVLLDLPHNLYQLAPDLIAQRITDWLESLLQITKER